MLNTTLFMAQRLTALIMAPLVLVHIAVMIHAVQGGLSAAEILSRTKGSLGWTVFYGTFVLAASLHAAIGLRVIASETFAGWTPKMLTIFTTATFLFLTLLGMSAVLGVVAPDSAQ